MRIALFVLSLLGLVGLSASQIGFTPVLPNGEMWSARDQAAVELVMKTTTFNDGNTGRQQRLTNYILLYGGQSGNGAQNDVWASQNGRVWYWVAGNAAGVNGDNSHPANPDTFEPMYETFSCQDGNYKQYLAGGRRDGILSSAVYTSIDGIRWDQRTPNAQWEPRYFASMVADSKNNVYMAGGILDDAEIDNKPRRSSQEVWRTTATSGGRDWTRVSAYPDDQTGVSDGPSRRAVSILLSTPQDQLIWLTGVNTGYGPTNNDPYESYLSDAWASGTGGRTLNWGLLTSNASYGRRDDANAEITSGGLIVLAGGYAGTETREVYNDVWASANGGYSWGLCQKESAWDDRRYQMTLLDANGNLWVMGGRDSVGGKLDDLWVSKESFNDANLITTRCKLTVPSCGTGLRCNPGAGTLIAADGTGAYCDSCPYTFSGQASTVTTLTAFLVVFVILTVLALAALGYTFYKLRSAGTPSPIPLPASAQRWWNKSSAGGAAGTTDSAATTNGDGLYQPLRIRDQV